MSATFSKCLRITLYFSFSKSVSNFNKHVYVKFSLLNGVLGTIAKNGNK